MKPNTNLTQYQHTTLLSSDEGLIHKANKLYGQHKSFHTRRGNQSDWRIFMQWSQQRNISPESASPEIIALFLTAQFEQNEIHPKTLTRRLVAIKNHFTERHLHSPTDHPIVRNLLKGIRRDEKALPSKSKNALIAGIVKSMVDLCPSDVRGCRDKVVLLPGLCAEVNQQTFRLKTSISMLRGWAYILKNQKLIKKKKAQ
jgi:hypothetical protein